MTLKIEIWATTLILRTTNMEEDLLVRFFRLLDLPWNVQLYRLKTQYRIAFCRGARGEKEEGEQKIIKWAGSLI